MRGTGQPSADWVTWGRRPEAGPKRRTAAALTPPETACQRSTWCRTLGMAINTWWSGEPSERFWVEITQRSNVGEDLWAPKTDQSGRPYWGYELLTYTRPGDVVFHWHKHLLGTPALIGWSVIAGPVRDAFEEWQPRGTYGRAALSQGLRPVWQVPLSGYTSLAKPVTEADVRSLEAELRDSLSDAGTDQGGPLYFPFAFSGKRPVRAAQTYFTKWPKWLNRVFGLAEAVAAASVPLPDIVTRADQGLTAGTHRGRARSVGAGYITDAVLRTAIEMRAVEVATAWYESAHYSVEYTGTNKPYDLVARNGDVERRVEVKGSTRAADKVVLTRNEVLNAREDFEPVDLFVVDGITVERRMDGSPFAAGGRSRRWVAWSPIDEDLQVTQYSYTLPREGDDR